MLFFKKFYSFFLLCDFIFLLIFLPIRFFILSMGPRERVGDYIEDSIDLSFNISYSIRSNDNSGWISDLSLSVFDSYLVEICTLRTLFILEFSAVPFLVL